MAYFPSSRPVTVALGRISGTQAACYWYNPADGSAAAIGTYPTLETVRSSPPPSPDDWILLIDDAALNLPALGSGAGYQ